MKTYLIVGAGPVGALSAYTIHKQLGKTKDIRVKVMEKRPEPGKRLELLYLKKDTFDSLPEAVKTELLNKENPQSAKAVFSQKSFNLLKSPNELFDDPHIQLTIYDLEKSLCDELAREGIELCRNMEFMTAWHDHSSRQYIAQFKNLVTGQLVQEPYDEMIIAIGFGGALKAFTCQSELYEEKQLNPSPSVIGFPRKLHSFPVVAARYSKNFREMDHNENPSALTYPIKTGVAGIGYTLDAVTLFTTAPPEMEQSLSDPTAQAAYINEAIKAIPPTFKHYLEDIEKPGDIKLFSAVCALNTQLDNPELRIHPIGDMLFTFPFIYGSETNETYMQVIPRLMKYLEALEKDPDEREELSLDYCRDLREFIISNEHFLRLLPFGEKIYLGERKRTADNKRELYHFPGWKEFTQLPPFNDKAQTRRQTLTNSPKALVSHVGFTKQLAEENIKNQSERPKAQSSEESLNLRLG